MTQICVSVKGVEIESSCFSVDEISDLGRKKTHQMSRPNETGGETKDREKAFSRTPR